MFCPDINYPLKNTHSEERSFIIFSCMNVFNLRNCYTMFTGDLWFSICCNLVSLSLCQDSKIRYFWLKTLPFKVSSYLQHDIKLFLELCIANRVCQRMSFEESKPIAYICRYTPKILMAIILPKYFICTNNFKIVTWTIKATINPM